MDSTVDSTVGSVGTGTVPVAGWFPTPGPGAVLDQNFIGALRPFAVDLLTATGLPPEEARAALPRM